MGGSVLVEDKRVGGRWRVGGDALCGRGGMGEGGLGYMWRGGLGFPGFWEVCDSGLQRLHWWYDD